MNWPKNVSGGQKHLEYLGKIEEKAILTLNLEVDLGFDVPKRSWKFSRYSLKMDWETLPALFNTFHVI